MDVHAPINLPAVRVVEGVPVSPPAFLGISIKVNLKNIAVIADAEYQRVDESALPDLTAVACVVPKHVQKIIQVPVVDSIDVTSGMLCASSVVPSALALPKTPRRKSGTTCKHTTDA